MTDRRETILVTDDDAHMRELASHRLKKAGYRVQTASTGIEAFKFLAENRLPGLILLDVMMPEMDGFEVCIRLKESQKANLIPVIFFTALETEKDRAKAFLSGGVDFIRKTASEKEFLAKIRQHLEQSRSWREPVKNGKAGRLYDFSRFKEFLVQAADLDLDPEKIRQSTVSRIYSLSSNPAELAKRIARFTQNHYMGSVEMQDVAIGDLPVSFCRSNLVIPLKKHEGGNRAYLISNPFDMDLLYQLEMLSRNRPMELFITEPGIIQKVFLHQNEIKIMEISSADDDPDDGDDFEEEATSDSIIGSLVDIILRRAINLDASDIHIEPKEQNRIIVRFRVNGEMLFVNEFTMRRHIGNRVLSRFKILGGMDITERRVPQDGAFLRRVDGKKLKFRLSTGPAYNGETLVVRLIDQTSGAPELVRLGMTEPQAEQLTSFVRMPDKLVLLVGVTGSGKSTTIRSALEAAADETRCILTVEHPVEGIIPYAVQLEVNERVGASWEKILSALMRQDPDVIVIGEIRDRISAAIAVEAALTGHLVVSTLHSAGAAEAIRRLGDLGITRTALSDAVRCVVAQTLRKKLCPYCRKIVSPSGELKERLVRFGCNLDQVALPVGCRHCGDTGYAGRVGIYEVLYFNDGIRSMVRNEVPVSEIRNYFRENGGTLIPENALGKLRNFVCSPEDILGIFMREDEPGFV